MSQIHFLAVISWLMFCRELASWRESTWWRQGNLCARYWGIRLRSIWYSRHCRLKTSNLNSSLLKADNYNLRASQLFTCCYEIYGNKSLIGHLYPQESVIVYDWHSNLLVLSWFGGKTVLALYWLHIQTTIVANLCPAHSYVLISEAL